METLQSVPNTVPHIHWVASTVNSFPRTICSRNNDCATILMPTAKLMLIRRAGRLGSRPSALVADGIEVHEPRLEERPRHRLQGLVHPPIQVDPVVQRSENVGDRTLFMQLRKPELH